MTIIKQIKILAPLLLLSLMSCGGDEITTESYNVSGLVSIADSEFWIDGQTIEVGLFTDATTADYSVALTQPTSDAPIAFDFGDVEEGSYTYKVFVAENGQYKTDIYSLESQAVNADTDLGNVTVNLLSYTRVQAQIFNRCTQCHGGAAGELAGNLSLLENESYAALVNIASSNADSELLRVKESDANNSFLMHVLNKENITFDHASSATATTSDIELVRLWIENGALND